ncbi:A-kinase anchor protein 17A-like [Oppia nitens]|uniref:A-kinase anchor protein 17A-like n=1 Tax=Oppia nitens TaxID=1686743 RepID=UPI0023DBCC93|nr:A-kinase anchor protein 17A-like [Oppia nitens]
MSDPHICDNSDLIELCPQLDLYLKPHAKLTITVTLPTLKVMDNSGQVMTISTWEVMDKLKKKVKPLKFKTLKVSKSNIEFIRFEAECDSQHSLDQTEARLNKVSLKLSGFAQLLLVKTARVKIGSTRHEWETFFRDNQHMNEMKAGCRPDTLYIQSLPVKWFGGEKPSPNLLVKVFGIFGDIRRFHIPVLDKKDEEDGFKRFNFSESLSFEAYLQYKDYISFVKAMDALKGMKLVKKLTEVNNKKHNYLEYDINVDFDKTKHLSDKAIKKRRLARDYGITSAVELKKLKDETKRQRELRQQRIDLLIERKKTAKTILTHLMKAVEAKVRVKKTEEEHQSAEQRIKDRLLLEEVKLREKLLERRREKLREEAKGKLKSVANINVSNNQTNNNNDINNTLICEPFNPTYNHLVNNNNNKSYSYHSFRRYSNNTYMNNHYLNYRRFLYLNHHKRPLHYPSINEEMPMTTTAHNAKALYKKHKKGCKHYKTKSVVTIKQINDTVVTN